MDLQENGSMEHLHLSNQEIEDTDLGAVEQEIAMGKSEESEKFTQVLSKGEETETASSQGPPEKTIEERMEVDSRSIYVGNVDYGATSEDLEQHFCDCGLVNRVVILKDKFTGHPKGFAFLEFADKNSVPLSLALDSSEFCGRQIKVMQKRTNTPGISTTNRPPRGGGRFRRSPGPYNNGGYRPFRRRA